MRPALRYHGGKWRLAPWIISHFPEHKIYVEPFAGGASVLLRKERSFGEVYNDLDDELVNYFRVLRDHGKEFLRRVSLTPFSRLEFNEAYAPDAHQMEPIERARLTLIKSFMGFGSTGISSRRTGFRAKGWRQRKTAADDWRGWPDVAYVLAKRLQGVVIEKRDAFEVIGMHDDKDTLFYVDPPYLHSTRGPDQRYRYELTDKEHKKLAVYLNAVKGNVVLSGYDSPAYRKMYKNWRVVKKKAMADGGRKRVEILWLNF